MNIGITGGSTLCTLGPLVDVEAFFSQIHMSCPQTLGVSLISDRLYKRYLRLSELDEAAKVLADIVKVMKQNSAEAAKADFAVRFLDCFNDCVESAKLNYEAFRNTKGYEYEPVRLVIADQPWFTREKQRALRDYDLNNGAPFWVPPVVP